MAKGSDVFNTVSPAGTNWGLGLMSMKRGRSCPGQLQVESIRWAVGPFVERAVAACGTMKLNKSAEKSSATGECRNSFSDD